MSHKKDPKDQNSGFQPLSAEQNHILSHCGTEAPGSSPLNYEKRKGTYHCARCGQALFSSDTKYESGSGWPSFFDIEKASVGLTEDNSLGMKRIEVHCSNCKGHLGHVFPDGPNPTGLRYCINGLALDFRPEDKKEA
ncbi:peptide-methionine (R)-S-oxide reductase MsrB [Aristophania vespae]|uniref:peptide-methionine (R)-S-oxide reductase n=1 Tax=Aristophania vespae TaxID=2697033 RepID=A0A6P1NB29_9PROT|nr:peptide-methionine (R)-S-oxide reductase MsrB [Aristophania vespae]QHI95865.1 peptide-methionine (R)-S-oxide reductase MsrB [Aristophania vespae]